MKLLPKHLIDFLTKNPHFLPEDETLQTLQKTVEEGVRIGSFSAQELLGHEGAYDFWAFHAEQRRLVDIQRPLAA